MLYFLRQSITHDKGQRVTPEMGYNRHVWIFRNTFSPEQTAKILHIVNIFKIPVAS